MPPGGPAVGFPVGVVRVGLEVEFLGRRFLGRGNSRGEEESVPGWPDQQAVRAKYSPRITSYDSQQSGKDRSYDSSILRALGTSINGPVSRGRY